MRTGSLRHRIDIQREKSPATRSESGEEVPVWQTLVTRYASIEPLSGRELWQARQVRPDVTHKIIMRFFAMTPKYRLKFGSRIFNVVSVLNPGERARGSAMELICVEEV